MPTALQHHAPRSRGHRGLGHLAGALLLALALWAGVAAVAATAPARATSFMVEDATVFGDPNSPLREEAYTVARHMGASMVRFNISRRASGWTTPVDAFVNDTKARALTPYLTLSYRPAAWGDGFAVPTPASFADWCGQVAQRYAGRGVRYSVWNEPNNPTFQLSSNTTTNRSLYAQFYTQCRAKVKQYDSAAPVYLGEIDASGTNGCAFLDGVVHQAGAPFITDGVALHTYQWTTAPSVESSQACNGIGDLDTWKTLISSMKDQNLLKTPSGGVAPILITEHAYCTSDGECPASDTGHTHSLDEATRASYAGQAFDFAESKGVSVFSYYELFKQADSPGNGSLWDTGIISADGMSLTPSIASLRAAVGGASPALSAPGVTATGGSGVTLTGATLNGTVNPNGLMTQYHVEVGTTTSYGTSFPAAEQSAGSGTGAVAVSVAATGLQRGTTYHYRVVAHNAAGTTYSSDATFATPFPPSSYFVDADHGNSLSYWGWADTAGWKSLSLGGNPAASGSSPAMATIDGQPYGFFVDAARGNQITAWSWNPVTGWQPTYLTTHAVAANTSPSVVVVDGVPHVFFVDATDNNTITDLTRSGSTWSQTLIFGPQVSAGSSPSAVVRAGTPMVYFSDAVHGNTISVWVWTATGWQVTSFGVGALATGTSPSAVVAGDTTHILFSDGNNGRKLADWSWSPTALQLTQLSAGPAVAVGSSPSAIVRTGTPMVFFSDASQSGSVTVWVGSSSGWQPAPVPLMLDSVATGSSPSATVDAYNTIHVFFSDANTNRTMSDWAWSSTSLALTQFFGPTIAAGTSPSR